MKLPGFTLTHVLLINSAIFQSISFILINVEVANIRKNVHVCSAILLRESMRF